MTTIDPRPTDEPRVRNGAYTLEHPMHGHFSVKVYTPQRGSLAGRRIVALLMGPNNRTDWKGVGFWNDAEGVVEIWKRFRGTSSMRIDGFNWCQNWNTVEKRCAIWADIALRGICELADETGALLELDRGPGHGYWYGEGYRMLLVGHCVRCNQLLTNPKSIRLGIGPECAKK